VTGQQRRQHRSPQPFWTFSPFNKKDGRLPTVVIKTRNKILDLYAEMASYDVIAERLDISISQVVECVARARDNKDPRVERPFPNKKIQKAETRRRQIKQLAADGYMASEIAKRLTVSKRLVQIRLKEGTNG
jgi:transposase